MPPKSSLTSALATAALLFADDAGAREPFVPGDALLHLRAGAVRRGQLRVTPSPGSVRVTPTSWFEETTHDGQGVVGFPRRLLLDEATTSMRVTSARERPNGAGSGSGVVIGIVDGGIDIAHPDLREPEGGTRMAFWIGFGVEPYGFYPELEADYGCMGGRSSCAILGRGELDQLLTGGALTSPSGRLVELPSDSLGHGTLVASLALGNGRSEPRFSGVAPEATLVGAQVAGSSGLVEDVDVLLATRFVFERARELGMPAVVNLSLGGDLGPHDGNSALERGLSEWVEDDVGRAIVVAAGNSGTLTTTRSPFPAPFGIHTDVHVPDGTVVRVPILFPASDSENALVHAWIATPAGEKLRVAMEEGDGTPVLSFVAEGELGSASNGEQTATIAHHVEADTGVLDGEQGIVVKLSGRFPANSVFALLLEGEANADLWLQSDGDLAPERGRGRAQFPAATRERTVNIPATSANVIAVGATLNRTRWTSFGDVVRLQAFDPALSFDVGGAMPFSSAGPSVGGALKPDLVAPGGVIIGALASGAEALRDGGVNWDSIFGNTPLCSALACAQVDDSHGVSLGTSMAAPLVSGAAALLLEKNRELDHRALRALLWAGARRGSADGAREGAGVVDVEGAFAAMALDDEANAETGDGCTPSRQSWLSFSDTFARPGSAVPLVVLLHLRDDQGRPCDPAAGSLEAQVANGRLTAFEREAGGLFRATLHADRAAGGEQLTLAVRTRGGSVVAALPIAVDSSVRDHGVSVRGGCATKSLESQRLSSAWLIALVIAGLTQRRIVSPRSAARSAEARPAR